MMHCPVCRAHLEQGPNCRRCRADLTLLFDLEKQRRQLLALAYRRLQQGRHPEARGLVNRAKGLRDDAEVRRLGALLCLLQRDFVGAWQAYGQQP